MSGRPIKRSLTLKGHRTSVSLEDQFWHVFQRIAAAKNLSINALAYEIDVARDLNTGLASAIRIYVLNEVIQNRLPDDEDSAKSRL